MGVFLSATTLFLAAVVMQAMAIQPMSSRLTFGTTFGTSKSTNDQPSKNHTVVTGKPCKNESECANFPNTSCVKTAKDQTSKRCLCGDKTGPVNGLCKTKQKGPGFPCNEDTECVEGAECILHNVTHTGTGLKGRLCICKQGYNEEDEECNGALLTARLDFASLLFFIFLTFYDISYFQ